MSKVYCREMLERLIADPAPHAEYRLEAWLEEARRQGWEEFSHLREALRLRRESARKS